MNKFIIALSLPLLLAAEEPSYESMRVLQDSLDEKENPTEEETQFLKANQTFTPLYAGPMITGGASNLYQGDFSWTPLTPLFTKFYGIWDHHRKSQTITDRYSLNLSSSYQVGITDWLDFTLTFQGVLNWEKNKHSGGFGDLTAGIGIPLLYEGLYQPAMRLVINQTFPTGRYQRLNPKLLGLDATGLGAYQTQFGLRVSKIILWWTKHPINLRGAYSVGVPTSVHVRGFNSYGGAHGTKGTLSTAANQEADLAFELSLTRHWVLAFDLVYNWGAHIHFEGFPGRGETLFDEGLDPEDSLRFDFSAPVVGVGSNDQLSMAPAIEYNPNEHISFLTGVWFNVYGRNVAKFVGVGATFSYSW
jgi:hypothetical protein